MVNGPGCVLGCSGVLALALAACGGRSISHGYGDDDTSSGGSGGSTQQSSNAGTSGSSGGPNIATLEKLCLDVCSHARAEGCAGYDVNACDDSCRTIDSIADQTASCANVLYTYLSCLDQLASLCALDALTVCNGGSNAVQHCISGFCSANPSDATCRE